MNSGFWDEGRSGASVAIRWQPPVNDSAPRTLLGILNGHVMGDKAAFTQ